MSNDLYCCFANPRAACAPQLRSPPTVWALNRQPPTASDEQQYRYLGVELLRFCVRRRQRLALHALDTWKASSCSRTGVSRKDRSGLSAHQPPLPISSPVTHERCAPPYGETRHVPSAARAPILREHASSQHNTLSFSQCGTHPQAFVPQAASESCFPMHHHGSRRVQDFFTKRMEMELLPPPAPKAVSRLPKIVSTHSLSVEKIGPNGTTLLKKPRSKPLQLHSTFPSHTYASSLRSRPGTLVGERSRETCYLHAAVAQWIQQTLYREEKLHVLKCLWHWKIMSYNSKKCRESSSEGQLTCLLGRTPGTTSYEIVTSGMRSRYRCNTPSVTVADITESKDATTKDICNVPDSRKTSDSEKVDFQFSNRDSDLWGVSSGYPNSEVQVSHVSAPYSEKQQLFLNARYGSAPKIDIENSAPYPPVRETQTDESTFPIMKLLTLNEKVCDGTLDHSGQLHASTSSKTCDRFESLDPCGTSTPASPENRLHATTHTAPSPRLQNLVMACSTLILKCCFRQYTKRSRTRETPTSSTSQSPIPTTQESQRFSILQKCSNRPASPRVIRNHMADRHVEVSHSSGSSWTEVKPLLNDVLKLGTEYLSSFHESNNSTSAVNSRECIPHRDDNRNHNDQLECCRSPPQYPAFSLPQSTRVPVSDHTKLAPAKDVNLSVVNDPLFVSPSDWRALPVKCQASACGSGFNSPSYQHSVITSRAMLRAPDSLATTRASESGNTKLDFTGKTLGSTEAVIRNQAYVETKSVDVPWWCPDRNGASLLDRLQTGDVFVKFNRRDGKPSFRYFWVDLDEQCLRWAARPPHSQAYRVQTLTPHNRCGGFPQGSSVSHTYDPALSSTAMEREDFGVLPLHKSRSSNSFTGRLFHRSTSQCRAPTDPYATPPLGPIASTSPMTAPPRSYTSLFSRTPFKGSAGGNSLKGSHSGFSFSKGPSVEGHRIPLQDISKILYTWVYPPSEAISTWRKHLTHAMYYEARSKIYDSSTSSSETSCSPKDGVDYSTYLTQLPQDVWHRTFVIGTVRSHHSHASDRTPSLTRKKSHFGFLHRHHQLKQFFSGNTQRRQPSMFLQLTCLDDAQLYCWTNGLRFLINQFKFSDSSISPASLYDVASIEALLNDAQSKKWRLHKVRRQLNTARCFRTKKTAQLRSTH